MRRRAALLVAGLAALPGAARAERVDTGINLEHFVPGIGPGAFLGMDGAGTAGPAPPRVSAALSIDWARGLLAVRNRFTGSLISQPVSSLLAVDLSAQVRLWRGLLVGAGLPVALLLAGDRLAGLGLGDESPLAAPVAGDLRLRLGYRLPPIVDRPALRGSRFDLTVLLVGTAPLGGQGQFFATAGPTLEPRLLEAWTSPGTWLRVAGQQGFVVAPTRTLYDQSYQHQLRLALGLELHVPRPVIERFHLLAQGELGVRAGGSGGSWAEARGGLAVAALHGLAVEVGAGMGTLDQPGGPRYRLFLALRLDR